MGVCGRGEGLSSVGRATGTREQVASGQKSLRGRIGRGFC